MSRISKNNKSVHPSIRSVGRSVFPLEYVSLLQVKPSTTVKELKTRLEFIVGIPVKIQRLFYLDRGQYRTIYYYTVGQNNHEYRVTD